MAKRGVFLEDYKGKEPGYSSKFAHGDRGGVLKKRWVFFKPHPRIGIDGQSTEWWYCTSRSGKIKKDIGEELAYEIKHGEHDEGPEWDMRSRCIVDYLKTHQDDPAVIAFLSRLVSKIEIEC